jgi:hypothetical protein
MQQKQYLLSHKPLKFTWVGYKYNEELEREREREREREMQRESVVEKKNGVFCFDMTCSVLE